MKELGLCFDLKVGATPSPSIITYLLIITLVAVPPSFPFFLLSPLEIKHVDDFICCVLYNSTIITSLIYIYIYIYIWMMPSPHYINIGKPHVLTINPFLLNHVSRVPIGLFAWKPHLSTYLSSNRKDYYLLIFKSWKLPSFFLSHVSRVPIGLFAWGPHLSTYLSFNRKDCYLLNT